MEYISCPEAAKKWGISERRVQKFCEDGRIPGVIKFGRMWMIPKDAKKPSDPAVNAPHTSACGARTGFTRVKKRMPPS